MQILRGSEVKDECVVQIISTYAALASMEHNHVLAWLESAIINDDEHVAFYEPNQLWVCLVLVSIQLS